MGKGSNTTTTATQPNSQAMAAYQALLARATNVASLPYTSYSGELVAPVNAEQNTGIANVNNYALGAQPEIAQAAGLVSSAAQPLTGAQIGQYMNPYLTNVVQATENQFANTNAIQQNQLLGSAAAQGALGGNNVGVAQGVLAGQQQTTEAPVIANLEAQGYNTAVQTAGQQFQQNPMAAAYGLTNVGVAGQSAGLQGAGAQIQAGTLQQNTQQALDTANYQQFVNQQAFPYQQAQWLAGIDTGVGSQMGGTSETTGPSPSVLSQLAGLGIAGAGIIGGTGGFGSNGWLTGAFGQSNSAISDSILGDESSFIGDLGAAAVVKRGGRVYQGGGGVLPLDEQYLSMLDEQGASSYQAGGTPMGPNPVGTGMGPLSYGNTPYGAQGGMVPQAPIVPGRTMPNPPQAPSQPQQQSGSQSIVNEAMQLAKALKSSDSMRRGGVVGLDTGGTPDPDTFTARFTGDTSPPSDQWGGNAAPVSTAGMGLPYTEAPSVQPGMVPAQPVRSPAPAPGIVPQPQDANMSDAWPAMPAYLGALKRIESDGDYGQVTDSGNGRHALGAYQVMAENVPDWTREALGRPLTPQQFLASPAAQDAVARFKFGQYVSQTGDPERAALMWFAGPSGKASSSDRFGTTGNEYMRRFRDALGQPDTGGLPSEITTGQSRGVAGAGAPSAMALGFDDEAPQSTGPHPRATATEQPSQAPWMGLVAAGLGMMGGTSPFPGVNIGQGGLQGLKEYQAQRQYELEAPKVQAEARRLSAEADRAAAQIRLETANAQMAEEQLQMRRQLFGGTGGGGQAGSPGTAPLAPVTSAPLVSPRGTITTPTTGPVTPQQPTQSTQMAPQESPAADLVPPQWRGREREYADSLRNTAAQFAAAGLPQVGTQYSQKAQDIDTALRTASETRYKAGYALREYVPTQGAPSQYTTERDIAEGRLPAGASPATLPAVADQQKELAKNDLSMDAQFRTRQVVRERLNELAKIMQEYQTGAYAQTKADLVANARAFGLPIKDFATANPADYQKYIKNATANIFAQAKEQGSKILVSELEGLRRANADPHMQPEANRAIIGQGLGLLDYEDKFYHDYRTWRRANPYAANASNFEEDWTSNHAPDKFTAARQATTPALGERIPPKEKLNVGDQYMINGKPAAWTGTGFKYVTPATAQ